MNRRKAESWRKCETVTKVARRAPVIERKVVRICSDGPAIGAVDVERLRVGLAQNGAEPMESARGQRDLKTIVVRRHTIRQAQDRVYVRVIVDVLFASDHSSAESAGLAVACIGS